MSPAPKRVLKNSGKTKSTPPKSKKEDLVKLVTGEEKKEVNVAGKEKDEGKGNGRNGENDKNGLGGAIGSELDREEQEFSFVPHLEIEAEEEEGIEDVLGIPVGARGGGRRNPDYERGAAQGAGLGAGAGIGTGTGTPYATQAEIPGEAYARTAGPALAENPFYGSATEYSSAQNYFQRAYQPPSAAGRNADEGRLERLLPSAGASRDEIPHGAQQDVQVYQERVDVRELLDLDTPTEKKLKRDRRASRI